MTSFRPNFLSRSTAIDLAAKAIWQKVTASIHESDPQSDALDIRHQRHHDVGMRTTLTLETDVAHRLKEVAHRERKPFKVVVNEALRAGLAIREKPAAARGGKIKIRSFRSRFKAWVDEGKLNQLVDELEAEDFVRKALK